MPNLEHGMKTKTYSATVYDEHDNEYTVRGTISKYYKATRTDPEEGGEPEIDTIHNAAGADVTDYIYSNMPDFWDRIEAEFFESASDEAEADYWDRDDYLLEQKRDSEMEGLSDV